MADAGTLGGIGGFLHGLNSQIGPYLDQQAQQRGAQETSDRVAVKKELRRKVQTLRAQNRLNIDDPLTQQAVEYAYSIGGKPPKGLENFMAISDTPPGVQDAFSQFLGGGQAQPNVSGGGQSAETPASPMGAGQLQSPATADPTAGNMYGNPTLADGAMTTGEKLPQGATFSYKMPGTGMTLSFHGVDLKTRDKLAIRRAAAAVKAGKPFHQAMEELPADVGLQFGEQMATHKFEELMAAGGDEASAAAAVQQEFGATPAEYKKIREYEQKQQIATQQAGPRADARNRSNLSFAGRLADAKNASALDYAGPIQGARTAATIETKAMLDPNERQAVGNALGFDMTGPLSADQENQLQGAMRFKKAQDTTSQTVAQQQVNPQEGYLAQQAANEQAGGKHAPASQVLQTKQDQEVTTAQRKEEGKLKVAADSKPVEKPALYRDPVTLEPAAIGTTLSEAKSRKLVQIDEKDTSTVVNLGRLEYILDKYAKLAPKLYPTDNAFANKLNFARLRASGDPLITELESYMPELTVLSRASGERGQSTNQDIARAASGLAKGTEFATQKGVTKAIKNTEDTVAKIRKIMGFQPKPGGAPQVGDTFKDGDVTIKRIK